MTNVIVSSKGQIVIPKKIREILGLIKGNKLKIFQENKKIILIAEPDVKQSELFVSASPYATDRAIKASHEIDETKINDLLHDLGIK